MTDELLVNSSWYPLLNVDPSFSLIIDVPESHA